MIDKDLLNQITDRTLAAIADEQDDQVEFQHDYVSALRYFRNYKKWYCKRNQPKNSIRLYGRLHDIERPYSWNCRLQVFIKGKFDQDIRITADAYISLSFTPECQWSEPTEDNQKGEFRYYKNPK